MKKYVLLLVAVLSAAISVTGLANSSSSFVSTPSLEATVKMFKPENRALAREFLTTVKSDKEYVQELATLINKEFGQELLYVSKKRLVIVKNDNVDLANVAEAQKMAKLDIELNKVLDEMAEKDKKNEGVFWSKGAQVNIAETELTHKFRNELK